jgi:ankyrin repeat protein
MESEKKTFLIINVSSIGGAIGGIILIGVIFLGVVGVIIYIASGFKTHGVRVGSDLHQYALQYMEQHKLLKEKETPLAYYDITPTMTGSEAYVLTAARVLHYKDDAREEIGLEEIGEIKHQVGFLDSYTINVISKSGKTLTLDIPGSNKGEDFYKALMEAWKSTWTPARAAMAEITAKGIEYGENAFVNSAGASPDTGLVELFLASGMSPNVRNKYGRTALMAAAEFGHVDILKTLLTHGADVNLKGTEGETALSIARKRQKQDIAALLTAAGAKD